MFSVSNVIGQNPVSFNYTTENGLPSNTIYSLIKDRSGFIWAGTDAGLVKFNGIRFQSFRSSSLKSRAVTGLTESNGSVFVYTFNDHLYFTSGDSLNEVKNWGNKISNISSDRGGVIWITSDSGLFAYEVKSQALRGPIISSDQVSKQAIGISVSSDGVFSIFENGVLQLLHGDTTLFHFDRPDSTPTGHYLLSAGIGFPWIVGFKNTEIYRHTSDGYEAFQDDNLKRFLSQTKVNHVRQFEKDVLWFCTNHGIMAYNIQSHELEIMFKNYSVSDICFDNESNMWLSTLHNGLIRVPDLKNGFWKLKNSDANNFGAQQIISANGSLYFTTTNGDFGTLNTRTNEQEIFTNTEKAEIQSMYFDSLNHQLIYFTNNKLNVKTSSFIYTTKLNLPPVKCIEKTKHGYLFGSSKGICFAKNLTDTTFQMIGKEWTRDLYFNEQNNTLYAATNSGISVYSYVSENWILNKKLLDEIQIFSIQENLATGLIYSMTFEGKIYEIDSQFNIKKIYSVGIDNQVQKFIVHDNVIYIAGNNGIEYISKRGCGRISKYDGLIANEIRDIIVNNDTIWIAASNGIQYLIPDQDNSPKTGNIFLKEILCGNEKINQSSKIEADYDDPLTIKIETTHYSSETDFSIAYRINAPETDWIIVPAVNNEITIPSLNPGNFTLQIKYVDHHGFDSGNTITLHGYVYPPWWKSSIFIALCAILILTVLFSFFRYRIKNLKRRQFAELKNLKIKNDLKEARLVALKTQMNPHFIFNVLNSIKSFIYKHDRENAVRYLNEFSGLMRHILECSAKKNISLHEEIESLKSYIQLEKMMLDENFEFVIEISPEIDESFVRIQPMLIQPFVENAFLHGLRHKKGAKNLALRFQLDEQNNTLVVEIRDNGIGRKASAKINQDRDPKHQSFAIESVLKRLNLSQTDSLTQTLNFEDLADDGGTVVTLKLSLQG